MDLFTAKKLTELRKHFSLSQEALAEKVGVSRQAISKWERGEASPDTDNLLSLSKIYNVSLDDLLGEKTSEEIISALSKKETAVNENITEEEEAGSIPFSKEKNEVFSEKDKSASYSKVSEEKGSFYSEEAEEKGSFYSEEKSENSQERDLRALGKTLLKIPYFLIAIIVFLIIGFSSKLWHPAWMLILTIPAYYLTAWGFCAKTKKGMLLKLPVYLYVIILFLLMGFTASLWHPMWILFLLIPAYYWFVSFNVKK